MTDHEIRLRFGACVPSLREQLGEQGCDLARAYIHQGNANAITRLSMHGLVTVDQVEAARRRLTRQILKDTNPTTEATP